MIEEIEQETLDIDWFFTNGVSVGFVASGGGKLPSSIAKAKDDVELLATFIYSLPQIGSVIINPNLESMVGKRFINTTYLFDFNEMAKRGLYAFDKTFLNDHLDTQYHLVASPTISLELEKLPLEIVNILLQTKMEGAIEDSLDIELFVG
jgi:hypothetical protein